MNKSIETTIEKEPGLWRAVAHFIVGDRGVGTAARLLITIVVLAGLLIAGQQGWSFHLVWSTAVAASYAALLVTSPTIRSGFQQEDFVGHWSYDNEPDEKQEDKKFDQAPERKRVVMIDRDQEDLRIQGWLQGSGRETLLFNATEVILTGFGRKSGRLFYWYEAPENAPPSQSFTGLVIIQWHKKYAAGPVTWMSGRYYGNKSRSMGGVKYKRISENEFLSLRDSHGP